jgi:hypothetical protein
MAYQSVSPKWKLRARIWICVIFLLLSGADYLLLKFTYDPFNPFPLLSGLAVLSALSTKMMLIGMWRRMSWARYSLGTLLCVSILAFAIALVVIVSGGIPRPQGLTKKPLAGIGLQVLALIPLAKSRSIRRQMHPMTGRD